jgi:hypothetical protein
LFAKNENLSGTNRSLKWIEQQSIRSVGTSLLFYCSEKWNCRLKTTKQWDRKEFLAASSKQKRKIGFGQVNFLETIHVSRTIFFFVWRIYSIPRKKLAFYERLLKRI